MASFRSGEVIELLEERADIVTARVKLAGGEVKAVGFPAMLGPVGIGDHVVVNTTGIELGLGTGGVGFMLWNVDGEGPPGPGPGHIVKLRYTPWQTEVPAAEAPESPHHALLKDAVSIGGMPVVACSLHSQMAAVAAGIKASRPDARVGYLMTDGAALPLPWSNLVRELKAKALLDVTCTAGHSFGGDLEAVNVFSGLVALRRVEEVDIAIAAMGPGVVGTGTKLGFSGMEQGQLLDAATALEGHAVAALRISFADARGRHRGISHHTLTALTVAAAQRCAVAVPELPEEQWSFIREQLAASGVAARHEIVRVDATSGLRLLEARDVQVTSMGRPMKDIPELFLAGAAAGALATRDLSG